MHKIHHTEAFILGSRHKGEDSKMLALYTRELGLVHAHAQGVRKLSSKLRFVLQDFSRVNIDLVRGKEIWRVTTAVPVHADSFSYRSVHAEKIIARVSALLMRLVAGEDPNEEVFRAFMRIHEFLDMDVKSNLDDYRAIELLSVSRILIALGYLSRDSHGFEESNEGIILPKEFSDISYQHRLIRDINQALAASQL